MPRRGRPHVICFSNRLPNPSYLSIDRWDIYRIKYTTKEIHKMSLDEVNDFMSDYVEWEKNKAIRELEEKKQKR